MVGEYLENVKVPVIIEDSRFVRVKCLTDSSA